MNTYLVKTVVQFKKCHHDYMTGIMHYKTIGRGTVDYIIWADNEVEATSRVLMEYSTDSNLIVGIFGVEKIDNEKGYEFISSKHLLPEGAHKTVCSIGCVDSN